MLRNTGPAPVREASTTGRRPRKLTEQRRHRGGNVPGAERRDHQATKPLVDAAEQLPVVSERQCHEGDADCGIEGHLAEGMP